MTFLEDGGGRREHDSILAQARYLSLVAPVCSTMRSSRRRERGLGHSHRTWAVVVVSSQILYRESHTMLPRTYDNINVNQDVFLGQILLLRAYDVIVRHPKIFFIRKSS